MAEKGFAIHCPHCQTWNVWGDVNLDEVALKSKEELKAILKGIQMSRLPGDPDSFSHPKLLQCKRPRWECPTSFEAFVSRSEKDAFAFLELVQAWSFKRDFRLYKADCVNRWDGKYYGILFCSQPVPRQRDIELEQLLDRNLISRTIAGISYEIKGPLTVFAANVFKAKNKPPTTYWMPIEGYSSGRLLVPPRFNRFCDRCRNIVMDKLAGEFLRGEVSPGNCPIGFGKENQCAGRKPACIDEDWNHCPAFIDQRKKRCPCYNSDLEAIRKVERKWRSGQLMEMGVQHSCKAGFIEIAFPIIVHDHLSGVAMTGQVFFEPERLTNVGEFVDKWEILDGYEEDLEKAKEELKQKGGKKQEEQTSSFFITRGELNNRVAVLYENVKRIMEMANSRYRDFRGRSEEAFREEVLGLIQNSEMESDFFTKGVLTVLRRMGEFWAFEGVFLGVYSYKTNHIYTMGYTWKSLGKAFGIPGRKETKVDIEHRQKHPCPYLYLIGKPPHRSTRLWHLFPVIDRILLDLGLEVTKDKYEFGVLVPYLDGVYAFLFVRRDEEAVCSLERRVPSGVTKLCQDAILQTCTQTVYELGELRTQEAESKRSEAEHVVEITAVAAELAHTLGNRAGTIQLVVNDIEKQLSGLGIDKNHKLMKRLNDLKEDTKRLMEVTNELKGKDYVRRVTDLDIRLVLAQAMREAELENITSGISVQGEVVRYLPKVRGVKSFLIDTFVNILQNAAQANANVINIKLVDNSKFSGTIDVEISDNGKGMDEKEKGTIFLPFASGRKGAKDAGFHIGLWVSKLLIVNMMQGDILVKSEVGKGSTFTVRLKVA